MRMRKNEGKSRKRDSNNVTGDYCYAKNKDNVLDFIERGPLCSSKKQIKEAEKRCTNFLINTLDTAL